MLHPHRAHVTASPPSAHTPVPVCKPLAPVPPTQLSTDPTILAATSVSSHYGRPPTESYITTKLNCPILRSFPALPEVSNPSPRLIPVPGEDTYHCLTALYADGETACKARDIRDLVRYLISGLVHRSR
jgi:hypothetical protein